MILVIDDNREMAECIAKATGRSDALICDNAVTAMGVISDVVPEMIFMEVILTGPDGFALLNELVSYTDTGKVPIVIVSSVDFRGMDLSDYGVVEVLSKDDFRPVDVRRLVKKFAVTTGVDG